MCTIPDFDHVILKFSILLKVVYIFLNFYSN